MQPDNEVNHNSNQDHEGWPIRQLWKEYESIAMHFNDLIIKLRTQALGAVAAISTLVGIFGKTSAGNKESWEIAATVFLFLCLFWIAIWVIDFCYYNRLLLGAVAAILDLEKASKTTTRIYHINISTKIQGTVAGDETAFDSIPCKKVWRLVRGRWAFYLIVFIALLIGLIFSSYEYLTDRPALTFIAPPA
jgi:hypothetical protein